MIKGPIYHVLQLSGMLAISHAVAFHSNPSFWVGLILCGISNIILWSTIDG